LYLLGRAAIAARKWMSERTLAINANNPRAPSPRKVKTMPERISMLNITPCENGFVIQNGFNQGSHWPQTWVAKDVPDLLAVIARILEKKEDKSCRS
jgi:hypothetical protein